MSNNSFLLSVGASALALMLTACGGGGGGIAPIATPTPRPTPTPAPTPTPTPTAPPIPDQPIGLAVNGSFAVFSTRYDNGKLAGGPGGLQFAYSAAKDEYTITIPGFSPGQLVTTGANGSYDSSGWLDIDSTVNDVTNSNGKLGVTLDWAASSDLKYTSMGSWWTTDGQQQGYFAYGVPTSAGDMPVTGSADYSGNIRGVTSGTDYVFGGIDLTFNFGSGTLSGEMTPAIAPVWDAISLGTYTFRDTVYSKGGTTFSGAFDVPGSTGASSFEGSFNGPNGAEVMGSWKAPYLNPLTNTWGDMSGVFAAGKTP